MLATDPLSLVFIACFLFGLLFLVVAALLGSVGGHGGSHIGGTHHIDVDGHTGQAHTLHSGIHPTTQGHSTHSAGQINALFAFINPTSIVLFLMGFGFFGYVLHNTSLALPLVPYWRP